MKVYNDQKTMELQNYDLSKGYLKSDRLLIAYHEPVLEKPEIGHYETRKYPNGGSDRRWVVDVPEVKAKDAWEEYEDILVYVPFTTEEMEAKRADEIKARLAELSNDFVQVWAGANISDIEDRKREFANLHNELRGLLGKTPRSYY